MCPEGGYLLSYVVVLWEDEMTVFNCVEPALSYTGAAYRTAQVLHLIFVYALYKYTFCLFFSVY